MPAGRLMPKSWLLAAVGVDSDAQVGATGGAGQGDPKDQGDK
jgi:hypothetical protein